MTTEATNKSDNKAGLVFTLCFLAGLCEGYDMLVAGITAPRFAPIFGLNPQDLGFVFSASTFGLFIGVLLGGRLADTIGRKTVLIASLIALGVFSIGTALAGSTEMLLLMRFLTGLGLGGTLPNILALTNESGSPEKATMRVTMLGSAMPFGGAIVGVLMVVQPDIDWKAVFWIGGLAPLAVAAIMTPLLPESGLFLQRKHMKDRSAQPPGIATALVRENRLRPSLLIWGSSLFTALALYMMINWLPTLLVAKGFDKSAAGPVVMFMTFGGAASGFVFGALARAKNKTLLYVFTWAGMAASVAGMAIVTDAVALACLASFGIGFFLSGGQFLLYALSTELYPAEVRGTGVGFAVGIGRLGAVAGPLLAGVLLMGRQSVETVILAVIPLIFVSLLAALLLIRPADVTKNKAPISEPIT